MTTRSRRRGFSRWAAATGALALTTAFIAVPAHADEEEEGEDTTEEQYVEDADENTLVVATSQSVENWNPFMQIYVVEHTFRQLQYEPLVRNSAEDYTATESLAEDWEESEDGLTWTFHMRDDATWHDGEAVTAEDVEYTFHILAEDEVISARNADLVELIDSVEALDEHTVEFQINEPSAGMEIIDQEIMPEHIWSEHEGNWNEFANDDFPIVGSGPYQMTEFETDTFIRYQANEDYWRGAPEFDEVVFQYYTEPDTAVAGLEAGEVDLIGGLNESQLERLEGQEGIETNVAPDRRFMALRFNTGAETIGGEEFGSGHPALADAELRNAIHHAIDKQELIDRVRGGYGDVASSIIPNVFSTIWWEPSDDVRVDFDLEEAERLLDEAGYEMGDNAVRVSPDGDPLEFTFGVDAGVPERENAAQFISEWLDEVGIATEQIISEDVQDMFDAGDIDMAFTGWGINPDPTYNINRQTCDQLPAEPGGTTTDAYYCDEEYDALAQQQQLETDEDARAELLAQLQEILYTEAPIITLWYPTVMEAYNSDKIADLTTQPAEDGMIMGQIGPWAYHSATPTGEGDTGTNTGVLIGAVVVVVLAGVILAVVLVRRRQTADDRE